MGGSQHHAPAAFTPGKDPVLIVQETGWAQGRSGRVRKISSQPGYEPRTVQTVASRYTQRPKVSGTISPEFMYDLMAVDKEIFTFYITLSHLCHNTSIEVSKSETRSSERLIHQHGKMRVPNKSVATFWGVTPLSFVGVYWCFREIFSFCHCRRIDVAR